jgi:hypothetical protein
MILVRFPFYRHERNPAKSTALIEAVQQECPEEALLFVVDYSTIAYQPDAEAQFREAGEKSGVVVIASAQEF